jgi:hypothetical protein
MKGGPIDDDSFPLEFPFKERKELDPQDQSLGLKEIKSPRAILDSKIFKGNSHSTPQIYFCLPNGDLSVQGARQGVLEDIPVNIRIEEIIDRYKNESSDDGHRNQYPEEGPSSSVRLPILLVLLNALFNRRHIRSILMSNDKGQMSNEFQSSIFKQIRRNGKTILDFDIHLALGFDF